MPRRYSCPQFTGIYFQKESRRFTQRELQPRFWVTPEWTTRLSGIERQFKQATAVVNLDALRFLSTRAAKTLAAWRNNLIQA